MKKLYSRLCALFVLVSAGAAWAQTDTNVITGSVSPPSRDIIITQTATTINLTVASIANYSNVTVSVVSTNGISFSMTEASSNGPFSGSFVAPLVTNATTISLQFIIQGLDLNFASGPTNISGTSTVSYIIVPRPVNDNFANAIKIPAAGGTAFGSNNYASFEAGEPVHAGVATATETVWWVWSPPVNENVLIDTSGSGFPPVLGVYTGLDVSDLTPVASSTNDIANGLKANVVFQALAGQTYHIAVAGYTTNQVGLVVLRVVPGGLPDVNPPAVTIFNPAAEAIVTTNIVAVQGVAKDSGPYSSGVASVFLQVNGGTPVNVFSSLGGVPSANWVGLATLPVGTNLISAYSVSLSGVVSPLSSVVVQYLNPINAFFSEALSLPGLGGSATASTVNAGNEAGQPLIAGNDGGHTIWYTFLAPGDGTLTVSTKGSSFDTILNVYTGSALTNLVSVAGNDDANTNVTWSYVSAPVLSNTLYYVAVDGFGGANGTVDLLYNFAPAYTNTPPTLFSVNVTAGAGGSVQPAGNNLVASNGVITLTATPSRDWAFAGWQGSGQSTSNVLNLVVTSNQTWQALFVLTNLLDTFSSGSLRDIGWTTSTNSPWFVESNNVPPGNTFAVRSGPITNNQSTSLSFVTNTVAGLGSFSFMVSSEANWDFLDFFINGTLVSRWSGNVAWTNYLFTVPAGTNTFTWTYVKDPTIAVGLDSAFIDNIYVPLPLASTSTNSSGALLTAVGGSPFQLSITGQAGTSYQIQGSVDLASWFTLGLTIGSTNPVVFTDSQSTNYPYRFYRAVTSTNQ